MERLDKYLSKKLNISREKAKQIIEKGYVTVENENENKIKPNLKISEDQKIEIDPKYIEVMKENKKEEIPNEVLDSVKIIYEDEYIYIIDKPAGIITESKTSKQNTLVDILRKKGFILSKAEEKNRDGIVHRLDKDTSGALIITKTKEANDEFLKLFKDRKIKKIYRCIVKGKPVKNVAYIEMPIKRDEKNRTKMKLDLSGKPAKSKFEVLKRYEDLSDLRVEIFTGRTHQIRVHMAGINHPVLGDDKYGVGRNKYGIKRQMLHSEYLEFVHPFTGENIKVKCELPEDYKRLLEELEKEDENK